MGGLPSSLCVVSAGALQASSGHVPDVGGLGHRAEGVQGLWCAMRGPRRPYRLGAECPRASGRSRSVPAAAARVSCSLHALTSGADSLERMLVTEKDVSVRPGHSAPWSPQPQGGAPAAALSTDETRAGPRHRSASRRVRLWVPAPWRWSKRGWPGRPLPCESPRGLWFQHRFPWHY